VREEEPAAAGAWINSISDPERRTAALQEHVGWWWENDSKAAQAWLNSLDVSAEVKADWRRAAEERAGANADAPVPSPAP
jgi:hypothetical protein